MASDNRIQFSADFDRPFLGPITEAPVGRVRDVLVCTNDPSVEVSTDEYRQNPPIGAPMLAREGGDPSPLELGRGLRIENLPKDESELIMNACTPRGHYFSPVRQFGERYSFVRDVALEDYEGAPYRWDQDDVISDALQLSRLVRDNAYSTEYAARVVTHGDGAQVVAWTLVAETKHVYRVRREREWVDREEGCELRDLLARYWAVKDALPRRVLQAMWRAEYASWLHWADLALAILVAGLEALLKTERFQATRQFTTRLPSLASELEIEGVDAAFADRMYAARSESVHGSHVQLFPGGSEAQDPASGGPVTPEHFEVFAEIARVQDVLRAAVRRAIEEDEFRSVFSDDETIRERWPVRLRR